MANSHSTLTSLFTDIASAIREKKGSTGTIVADAFPGAIRAIDTNAGTDELWNRILKRSFSKIENEEATSIESYAFAACYALTAVSFPAVQKIKTHAFFSCDSLNSVSFPVATTIYSNAFCSCRNLFSANFPNVEKIYAYAFAYCTYLSDISFPAVTTISSSAFYACDSLVSVNLPAATLISNGAFRECNNLNSVSFPAATTIKSYVFFNSSRLTTLLLLGSNMCTLENSNAFYGTGITSSTGFIYVPASLLGSYKTSTNWSYFSDRIFSYTGQI